jgi:hypothetical protein
VAAKSPEDRFVEAMRVIVAEAGAAQDDLADVIHKEALEVIRAFADERCLIANEEACLEIADFQHPHEKTCVKRLERRVFGED